MRLFLAAPVPASGAYAEVTQDLVARVPRARPVPTGTWHVTLQFLGEVPSAEPILAAASPIAARVAPAPLSVHGVGAFPTPGRARVAWAGVDCPVLAELATALRHAIPGRAEDKPFHAHVTLARIEPPADVRPWCAEHANATFGAGHLTEVVLFRSDLGAGGPRYTKLAQLPLGGA